jgi:uncharacterized membrane protein
MYGSEFFSYSLWWICPILMIAMCFFMMRRRRDSMMCGFGFRGKDRHHISTSDSATDIHDKRYAFGEIDKEEYEERKRTLTKPEELFQ